MRLLPNFLRRKPKETKPRVLTPFERTLSAQFFALSYEVKTMRQDITNLVAAADALTAKVDSAITALGTPVQPNPNVLGTDDIAALSTVTSALTSAAASLSAALPAPVSVAPASTPAPNFGTMAVSTPAPASGDASAVPAGPPRT